MKLFITKWYIELITLVGNSILVTKYLIDKTTIHCEPCISASDCPPCETEYMKRFWYYFIIFQILIIIGYKLKMKLEKKK